ncbi:FMN-binding domain-containing protein [Amycolatopsis balhimycina DSM 5908]|uniref:FMN-binding domain-containing protein n=1 Tax=Amycolatopsis balhimycina DSM 5908 TaxID=1081091 RepID=A0A428W1R3_AMYBA|nr:FMN-binding protein [Amycolatopsis balhimycina]RSM36983.1 FMN-binding domain-containing protein [Amycolatopsis balhimycina DSM 5908]
MKKTIFVVALSIAGFIAVWRFEPGPVHNTAAVAQAPPPVVTAPVTSAAPTTTPAAPSTSAGQPAPSTSDSPSARDTPDETVTTQGSAESSQYGTVQVQVTFTGSRIAVITLLQAPDGGRSLTALPKLQQEAIKAQSANIDTVTGATETSESYKTSLQAAIDAKGKR